MASPVVSSDSPNTKKQQALNIAMQHMMVSSKTQDEFDKTKSLGMINKNMFSTWKSSKPLANTLLRKNKLDIYVAIPAPCSYSPVVVAKGSRGITMFDHNGQKQPQKQKQRNMYYNDDDDIHNMIVSIKEEPLSAEQVKTYHKDEFEKVVRNLLKNKKIQTGDVISTQLVTPVGRQSLMISSIMDSYSFCHVVDMGPDFVTLFDVLNTIIVGHSFGHMIPAIVFPLSYSGFVKTTISKGLSDETPTSIDEYMNTILTGIDMDDEDAISAFAQLHQLESIFSNYYIPLYELPKSVLNAEMKKSGSTYASTKNGDRIIEIPKGYDALTKRIFTKISLS